jgi:hypothetical protein
MRMSRRRVPAALVLATVAFGIFTGSAQAVPSITTPAPGASTADATPTIAGTADPGPVTVELSQAGAGVASFAFPATANDAGVFSVDSATPLTDGGWTVVARQATATGLQTSTPVTFIVDTVAPVVALAAPAEGAAVTTSRPVITGSAGTAAGDADTVAVTLAGPTTTTLTAARGADGSFAVQPAAALPAGAYVATAAQTDAASNAGTSAPRAFRIQTRTDTRAPETTITAGPTPLARSTRTVQVDFSADETATFRCLLDGKPVTPCAAPQVVLRRLTKGRHRLAITAIDAAGNADATPAVRSFAVDLTAPVIPIARSVRITGGELVRFSLRCPSAQAVGPCAGTLSVSWDGRSAVVTPVAFRIAAGESGVVRVRLTRAARRALRRNGRLSISLRLVAVDSRANVGRASAGRTLTLPGSSGT